MDTNVAGNTPTQTTNTEEQSSQPGDTMKTNTSKDSAADDIKENVYEQSAEVMSAAPKQTIEILKVELVAAGWEKTVEAKDDGSNMKESVENKEVNKEYPSSQNSRNISEKNKIQQESVLNKVIMESNKMDENEGNVQSTQIKDNENNTNLESNEMGTNDENVELALVEGKDTSDNKTKEPSLESTGLSLLAQYDSDSDDKISDSDSDSVIEVPPTGGQDYRNQVVEIYSDSDSDDNSDCGDVEYLNELRKTIEKHIEVADEDNEEDEDGTTGKKKHIPKLKVKGELLLDDLPPIQDLQITVPEDECIKFGKIHSIVDQLVLINVFPNSILLDLDTVIFLEKGQKVLGEVFDVLGQVADPLYCVRFNSNKQIKEKQINVGDVVYVAPKTQYTQYVILSNLMKTRGSDASWENDMEPPPRFLDYSDDEQEQLAKRQLRNKDRPMDNDDPTKRLRTVGDEDSSNSNRSHSNAQQRNHYTEQRRNRGGSAGHYNNNRPRYSGPQHCQQRTSNPNHHRSSWHSNYYPQSYAPQGAYGMPPGHNQPQTSVAYSPHVSMYAMPPMHNMTHPPPPQQYGAPPMLHPQSSQPMPNTFSIRPSTLHGPPPHVMHHQQYTAPPPPPPGSQ